MGRTCYKSENKITDSSSKKFVKMLKDRGHEAMIEHATASFKIITDRGITHEIVRHRISSFGQESTRYCNYLKKENLESNAHLYNHHLNHPKHMHFGPNHVKMLNGIILKC